MLWVLLASIPPCLWAITNIIDEFLSKEHFAKNGALFMFLSAVFEGAPAIILWLFFVDQTISVPFLHVILIGALGFILTCSFVPYIYALQLDNASNATPIFQTIPVFVFFLGWLFLGETANIQQIFAAILIIVSSVLIGVNFKNKKIHRKAVSLMFLSSIIIALQFVSAKYFIDLYGWATVTCYSIVGASLLSTLSIAVYKPWRMGSIRMLSSSGVPALSLFFLAIGLHILALALLHKAVSIGPSVALVSTVSGSQPAFVLLFAMLAGLTASHHFPKVSIDRALLFKFVMVGLLMVGIYLLART